MKTDVIVISSEGNNMETALAQIDKISAYKELSPKSAMTLRLLTEEVLAMMRAIAGNVNGEFWIEDQDNMYELHLLVRTLVDDRIREQLLAASSSGKNEATRGFMGKIRSFFEPSNGAPMFSAGFAGGAPPAKPAENMGTPEDGSKKERIFPINPRVASFFPLEDAESSCPRIFSSTNVLTRRCNSYTPS